ncbi:Inositol-tetrakisphosphate 1-kinase [Frankliniella fusca]|uniref:Inositol-tetrakisphosphate 1-kinase n=1 Tax=Frankliniella fusca TaxID=407009 RepID=A0AAE1GRB0_9NEOP|nr:Inositol-tetrakisphosphate 1-kinase [Frankliniella fusca]
MENESTRVIGYYVTEKKNAKMNWSEFGNVCRNHGFSLMKVNLQESLEKQGPFFAIIHKMTEVILKASSGDLEATAALENVESYIKSHPEVIVVDPLDGVRSLMDRSRYYRIVQNSDLAEDKVFTPTFVDLTSTDLNENLQRLNNAGVTYPFICKPSVSHGSDAHQMAIVFNEEGVADCRPPCVAQSFINHNAVLYKIYIVGDDFNVSERPSLKNFAPSGAKTIFFTTSDVSKPDSRSSLTVLDPKDSAVAPPSDLDVQRLQHIVSTLRRELGMLLLGVDVVIEHASGRFGIIDVNVFPSYEGFPNFFETLMNYILDIAAKRLGTIKKSRKLSDDAADTSAKKYEKLKHHETNSQNLSQLVAEPKLLSVVKTNSLECDQDDSGFDTSDSSDERKKKWCIARGRGDQSRRPTHQLEEIFTPSEDSPATLNDNCVRTGLGEV